MEDNDQISSRELGFVMINHVKQKGIIMLTRYLHLTMQPFKGQGYQYDFLWNGGHEYSQEIRQYFSDPLLFEDQNSYDPLFDDHKFYDPPSGAKMLKQLRSLSMYSTEN